MVLIVEVKPGESFLASHLNQYHDAFKNVFGITDSGQDALGRQVMSRSASPPTTNLVDGQIYYDTDIDLNMMRIEGSGANWKEMGGIRQAVHAQLGADANLADFLLPIVQANITTTGGHVFMLANIGVISTADGTGGDGQIDAEIRRGSTVLRATSDRQFVDANLPRRHSITIGALDLAPAASSYTYDIRARYTAAIASATVFADPAVACRIMLLEFR
jgi:hypothetical protein